MLLDWCAHVGEFAEVSEYIVKRSSTPNEVQFGDFGTIISNVFAIGGEKHRNEWLNEQVNPMMEQNSKVCVNIGVGEGGDRLVNAENVLEMVTGVKPQRTLVKFES